MVSKCGDFKKQKFNEYPIDDRWWVKIAEHPEHAHDGKSMDDIAKKLWEINLTQSHLKQNLIQRCEFF